MAKGKLWERPFLTPMCARDQHLMATMSVSITYLCVYKFAYANSVLRDRFIK